ncbi:hypothetical protein KVQ01_11485 [Escherichia coli]|uniref:hypothetical protein n=1 Tax=Escherichia coli TaxID=562 RepID=UPI001F05FC9B|nr:hypothetical protein [Escherichia coli]MCH0685642.1 hypothetical protein [Escherichia coli]MDZ8664454.1 hypothetical protein [Escherichia coli]WRX87726.1 hypothetical protein SM938_22630 [Escherichia coli]HCO3755942.1 hypothetical protein [Escherichia coli]HCO3884122.1 hypothetical protein [Escherichia coli]
MRVIDLVAQEYEAALTSLAASQKVEWDGNYPIKPGTDVDVHFDGDDCRVWTTFRVEYMRGDVVVLHDYRTDDVGAYSNRILNFRPIRSEADKKKEEAIASMASLIDYRSGCSAKPLAGWLFEEIAAGKIPHIRIE